MPYRPVRRNALEKAKGYALQRASRLDPRLVAYNSFWGQFSDSPRAICEELLARDLGFDHLWVSADDGVVFPGQVRNARLGTSRYYAAVGRARLIVSNNAMPQLAKRPGVTYLQTWHGTPLKQIGFDNANYAKNPTGLRRVARDYRQWDYLISQNRYSTEIFRRAFRFDGEILETGYPRNDILSAPHAPQVRERVRSELGLSPETTAVLYAPTYRDKHRHDGQLFAGALDLSDLRRQLGADFVFLQRLHYSVAPVLGIEGEPGVMDVSAHEDIRELYLAADVLITDYSSVMFDFAVTRKPMIWYLPDYDEYTSINRQHYFDIVEQAPGPVLTEQGDITKALRQLPHSNAEFAKRYEEFWRTYCYLDDGLASQRVVDRVIAAP